MINFVLKKFIKNLNRTSLSVDERAVLREEFLLKTGLCAPTKRPSLRSFFVLIPSKIKSKNQTTGKAIFDLRLVEERSCDTKEINQKDSKNTIQEKKGKTQMIENGIVIKINLSTADKIDKQVIVPKTFVIMKVVPV